MQPLKRRLGKTHGNNSDPCLGFLAPLDPGGSQGREPSRSRSRFNLGGRGYIRAAVCVEKINHLYLISTTFEKDHPCRGSHYQFENVPRTTRLSTQETGQTSFW